MATKQNLIRNAKKYVGKVKYVWGGDCAEEGGFDCSGYMYNVMKDSGMKVGRTTAQGYANTVGTEINKAKIGVSDLMFFGKSKKKITHIAMYAGDGKMYESQGGSKNTKSNPGTGCVLSNSDRRSDLVIVKRICVEKPTVAKPILKKRTVGNDAAQVKLLQQDLNYIMDAGLVVDGSYGSKTVEAVKAFNKKYGITTAGTYGKESYAKMQALLK